MNGALLVFLGGGLGSLLRYGVYRLAHAWLPPSFPWGTLIVNVAGSVAAGLIAAFLIARSAGGISSAGLFLMTGLLGGFTTFSAFSLEAVMLWQKGQTAAAAAYVLGSVLLSIAGVVAGLWAARLLS